MSAGSIQLCPNDSFSSPKSVPQFIIGSNDTAVLHRLHLCLTSDVDLNLIFLIAVRIVLGKNLSPEVFLLQCSDELAGFRAIAQFRIFENVRRTFGVNL